MNSRSVAEALASVVTSDDENVILEGLRGNPQRTAILEDLARHRDLEVRGWVPAAARQILGPGALPLLQRLFRDSDPDIRGLALDAIEQLDPALLDSMLPELRRRLSSKDRDEVIATAWRLAARGDEASVPLIDAFRDRHEPWVADYKAASVILLLMLAPEEIASRIDSHDHDHMVWLPYAAILSGRPDAIEAAKRCAETAPDDFCRRFCQYSIDKFAKRDLR